MPKTPIVIMVGYYLLSPLLCILIGWTALQKLFEKQTAEKTKLLFLILFSVAYSLVFLTRSFVRHSLFEAPPYPSTPLLFLAIIGIIWLLYEKYSEWKRFMIALIVLFILSLIVTIPTKLLREPFVIKVIEQQSDKPQRFLRDLVSINQNSDRSLIPATIADKQFSGIKTFFEQNLTQEETFFDLSGHPMLYYVLRRENPLYVNHQMLFHDAYLQERTIEQLTKHDVPVVIYQREKKPFDLDGVPFQYRYYQVSEYIQAEYHPFMIVNEKEIWVRNNWILRWSEKQQADFIEQYSAKFVESPITREAYNLGAAPLLWGMTDDYFIGDQWKAEAITVPVKQPDDFVFIPKDSQKIASAQYIFVTAKKQTARTNNDQKNADELEITSTSGEKTTFTFTALPPNSNLLDSSELHYAFRLSAFPEWSAASGIKNIDVKSKNIDVENIFIVFE